MFELPEKPVAEGPDVFPSGGSPVIAVGQAFPMSIERNGNECLRVVLESAVADVVCFESLKDALDMARQAVFAKEQ